MKNVDDAVLMAYLDGELEPDERAAVENYLQQNPAARATLEKWAVNDALVTNLLDEALSRPLPPIAALDARRHSGPVNHARPPAEHRSLVAGLFGGLRNGKQGGMPGWAMAAGFMAIGLLVGGLLGQNYTLRQVNQTYMQAGLLAPQVQLQAQQVMNKALEQQLSGESVTWQAPDSGAQGSVTPVRTFRTDEGVFCREFLEERVVYGQSYQARGIACRGDKGWALKAQRYNGGPDISL